MVEQQANPLLRGRPVGVTNRLVRGAIIVAASYEAKKYGIGVGTRMEDAKAICPDIVILETDPPKYIHTYQRFLRILKSYSPDAQMKSVDEGVIDFKGTRRVNQRSLLDIGKEIKAKFRSELGDYMTCNIGIAPSRWLAKTAAGLNKPDGMDVINHHNLVSVMRGLKLLDLTGINRRYQARLNAAEIFTPLDFLNAPEWKLTSEVFHSINGHHWYSRLRGWEVDDYPTVTRTIGKQYVVPPQSRYSPELYAILAKMCEMMGRRMRGKGYSAHGLFVGCWLEEGGFWHARKKFTSRMFTTQELTQRAFELFNQRPEGCGVKTLSINTYALEPASTPQLQLFETADRRRWRLTQQIDALNNRYGEFSVMQASMAGMEAQVADKIPFGSTRYFEYQHSR